jgi:hypothetical protein
LFDKATVSLYSIAPSAVSLLKVSSIEGSGDVILTESKELDSFSCCRTPLGRELVSWKNRA